MSVREGATNKATVLGDRKPTDFDRRMSRSDLYCVTAAIVMLTVCMFGTVYWPKVTSFFWSLF